MKPHILHFLLQLLLIIQSSVKTNATTGPQPTDTTTGILDGMKVTSTVVPSPTEPIPGMSEDSSGDHEAESEYGAKTTGTVVPSPTEPTPRMPGTNTTVGPQPTESTTGIPGDSSGSIVQLIIGLVSAVVTVSLASCIIVAIACCCYEWMKKPDRTTSIYSHYYAL